jgi:RNA:NAD 2'-phosphotransferase (TPT1/KptA family)
MTNAQEDALSTLRRHAGQPVVLHVAIGGALVKAGYATKDNTKGHGKLQAAYRLK